MSTQKLNYETSIHPNGVCRRQPIPAPSVARPTRRPGTAELLNAYIEITPFDLMKYEIDKDSGYLRVDRPQRSSSQPPTLYGFIPEPIVTRKCAARPRQ